MKDIKWKRHNVVIIASIKRRVIVWKKKENWHQFLILLRDTSYDYRNKYMHNATMEVLIETKLNNFRKTNHISKEKKNYYSDHVSNIFRIEMSETNRLKFGAKNKKTDGFGGFDRIKESNSGAWLRI